MIQFLKKQLFNVNRMLLGDSPPFWGHHFAKKMNSKWYELISLNINSTCLYHLVIIRASQNCEARSAATLYEGYEQM